MDRILIFDHNIKDIGLYTRPSTQGDELDLVEDFIEYYIHNFLKSNKTNNLAIFVEPKLHPDFLTLYLPHIHLKYWRIGLNKEKIWKRMI